MRSAAIGYSLVGRTALITINRPEVRNAVNVEVAEGIESALDALEADDDVWCGVLTGAGGAFCSGADLRLFATGDDRRTVTERGGFAGIVRRARRKPLIAAVNGPALAGGCEIALACDLIVASSDATFGLPEVRRSLVANAGGLARLPRTVPRHVAMHMLLTGDSIDAQRAYELGLVSVLGAPDCAVEVALELAARINENAPLAVRATRRIVVDGADAPEETVWGMARAAGKELAGTADYQEGPRAFVEKRPPRWQGK